MVGFAFFGLIEKRCEFVCKNDPPLGLFCTHLLPHGERSIRSMRQNHHGTSGPLLSDPELGFRVSSHGGRERVGSSFRCFRMISGVTPFLSMTSREKKGAGLRGAFTGPEIDMDEAESTKEGTPFIVVHQRPVDVASHIHPSVHGLLSFPPLGETFSPSTWGPAVGLPHRNLSGKAMPAMLKTSYTAVQFLSGLCPCPSHWTRKDRRQFGSAIIFPGTSEIYQSVCLLLRCD